MFSMRLMRPLRVSLSSVRRPVTRCFSSKGVRAVSFRLSLVDPLTNVLLLIPVHSRVRKHSHGNPWQCCNHYVTPSQGTQCIMQSSH